MKLLFLGTGAADWPQEKPSDQTEHRRFSSALIDGTLLIDPGPQVPKALREQNIPPSDIRFVINTHRHSDHFSDQTLAMLKAAGAQFVPIAAGETQQIGRYTISAYRANHGTVTEAVHFIITDGERTLFYGLDGAWLLYEEVQAIKAAKPDLAVLDATIGFVEGDYRIFEHNDLTMVLQMQKTLAPYIGRFCISHMAYTLHTDHGNLTEAMRPYDILVAFDGLEVTL